MVHPVVWLAPQQAHLHMYAHGNLACVLCVSSAWPWQAASEQAWGWTLTTLH